MTKTLDSLGGDSRERDFGEREEFGVFSFFFLFFLVKNNMYLLR